MIMFPTFRGGLASSTPPAVPPPSLPANPALWLEADQITGLSDGNLVATWENLANGWNFTQGTSGARPEYKTNIVNGLPVVRFTTGKDLRVTSGAGLDVLRNTAGGTLLVVRKHASTPTTTQVLLEVDTATLGIARAVLFSALATSNRAIAGGRRLDANSFQFVTSTGTVDTAWAIQIGCFDYAGATLQQYVNGVKDGESLTFQTSGNTSNTASNRLWLGDSVTNPFLGDMAAVMIWDRVLTAGEIADATAYFALKYDITLP